MTEDCGTSDGSLMRAIVEGGEVVESLRERILGRTAADDWSARNNAVVVRAGQMLDEDAVDVLEAAGVDEVRVRTALTCGTRFGLCAKCYSRDLGRGGLVNVGGPWASSPRSRSASRHAADHAHLPHRRCAVAQRTASSVEAKSAGRASVSTPTMRYVTNTKGELVVISRSGEITIHDEHGRERERHKGALRRHLTVKADQTVKAGTILANWDPLTRPIITESPAGQVRERRGRPDGGQAGGRRDRPVDAGGDRPQAPWLGQDRAPAGQADRRRWQRGQDPRHRPFGDHRLPGRRADPGARRPGRRPRRGAGAVFRSKARRPRHHRRSAARGRAVRRARPGTRACWPSRPAPSRFGKRPGQIRLQITDPDGKGLGRADSRKRTCWCTRAVVNKGESYRRRSGRPQDILRLLGIESCRATSSTRCRTSTACRA